MVRIACANSGSLNPSYVRQTAIDLLTDITNVDGEVDIFCVHECGTYSHDLPPLFETPFSDNQAHSNEKTRGVCTFVSENFKKYVSKISLRGNYTAEHDVLLFSTLLQKRKNSKRSWCYPVKVGLLNVYRNHQLTSKVADFTVELNGMIKELRRYHGIHHFCVVGDMNAVKVEIDGGLEL